LEGAYLLPIAIDLDLPNATLLMFTCPCTMEVTTKWESRKQRYMCGNAAAFVQ
jgi:hypothetical protein